MSNVIKFPETDKERQEFINKLKSKDQQDPNNDISNMGSCIDQQTVELQKLYISLLQSKTNNLILDNGQLVEALLLGTHYGFIKQSDADNIFSDLVLKMFSLYIANTDYDVTEFCNKLKEL